MTNTIYIGIDPAFRTNGFAICIIDEEDTVSFKNFRNGFREFIRWVMDDAPTNAKYCVENSNLQNSTFDMRGSKGVVAKVSRSVGKNQAISQLVVDLLEEYFGERNVYNIRPKEKGKKITDLALFDAYVESNGHEGKMYGYKRLKKQQDERDAYKLAIIARQKHKKN